MAISVSLQGGEIPDGVRVAGRDRVCIGYKMNDTEPDSLSTVSNTHTLTVVVLQCRPSVVSMADFSNITSLGRNQLLNEVTQLPCVTIAEKASVFDAKCGRAAKRWEQTVAHVGDECVT